MLCWLLAGSELQVERWNPDGPDALLSRTHGSVPNLRFWEFLGSVTPPVSSGIEPQKVCELLPTFLINPDDMDSIGRSLAGAIIEPLYRTHAHAEAVL